MDVPEDIVESKAAADEDTVSIFAGVGDTDNVVYEAGERVSEFSLYKRVGDDDIVGNYQIVDQGVIVSKKNEDNISVMSFSVQEEGDNVSLRSVTITKDEVRADSEAEDDYNDDADSVKTLTGGEVPDKEAREDVTKGVVFNVVDATNGVLFNGNDDHAEDDIEIHPDDAEDTVELDEYKASNSSKAEDSLSIRSYSIHGDYILSLHQRVGVNGELKSPKRAVKASPTPAPRAKESVAVAPKTETVVQKSVLFTEEYNEERKAGEEVNNNVVEAANSYEEERSKLDFEAIVRENMDR